MADGRVINEVLLNCDKLSQDIPIKGLNDATVGDYWSWAYSNILCNANRCILAEFIVGKVLDAVSSPRVEWDPYDLSYNGKKIEIKCSAYLQSWPQYEFSRIQFDIGKKEYQDAWTHQRFGPDRFADCYVFCLYPEKEPCKVDILDVGAWEFYVVSKDKIAAEFGDQGIVGLSRLQRICSPVKIGELRPWIDTVINSIGHD